MDNEKLLQHLSVEIDALLQEYVNIHNKIFNKAATFKSLFKRINFKQLFYETVILAGKFGVQKSHINELKNDIYGKLNIKQKEYLDTIFNYFNALDNTVKVLAQKTNELYKKSEGGNYSFSKFMSKESEYKDAVNKYLDFGAQLNDLYTKGYYKDDSSETK